MARSLHGSQSRSVSHSSWPKLTLVVSIAPQVVAFSLVEATPEMAKKYESDKDDGEEGKPEMETAPMRGRKGDSDDEVSERGS